jgi:hypothetical protein
MNSAKQYLVKIVRGVFHRGETFAVEGGISFGPGHDPKGSFYNSPKVAFYWYQPESDIEVEERAGSKGLLKGLVMKLGSLRLSA